MKAKYYLFLIALFSILAILIILLKESLELSDWITISATLGATFAALATGVRVRVKYVLSGRQLLRKRYLKKGEVSLYS